MKTKPIRSEEKDNGGGGNPASSFTRKAIVIGGGAAGLMAAQLLAGGGIAVTLLEKNARVGRKLAISGKGRCNFTNMAAREDFFSAVVTNPKFLYSAIHAFDADATVQYFESLGLQSKVERGKRVFPVSDRAQDVVDCLVQACHANAVDLQTETEALEILTRDGRASGVRARNADGEFVLEADVILLATGGLSYPVTGSTGDGYRFAKELGHVVSETFPALVPFVCKEEYCATLAGLAPKNVRFTVKQKEKVLFSEFGEMLFTHSGVSGPLVLSASSYVTRELAKGALQAEIHWKPYLEAGQLDADLLKLLAEGHAKTVQNALSPLYPASLLPVLLALAAIDTEKKAANLTKAERERIVKFTEHFPLTVERTSGYREAVVTQGGIAVSDIVPKTMESKLVPGLYCIGEVLDLDALTGGFNLQIAWSTAHAATTAVLEKQRS